MGVPLIHLASVSHLALAGEENCATHIGNFRTG